MSQHYKQQLLLNTLDPSSPSFSPFITPKEAHNWQRLCQIYPITLDIIHKYPHIFQQPASFSYMSANVHLNDIIIINFPDALWDWNKINVNPTVTLEMILSLNDKPWSFPLLSLNLSKDMKRIKDYFPHGNWNRHACDYRNRMILQNPRYLDKHYVAFTIHWPIDPIYKQPTYMQ